jgi:hypothetical protein
MPSRRPLLRWALLASAAGVLAGGGPATAAGDDEGLPTFLAPLRADRLARQGKAAFRHSESDLGAPGDAFDGRNGTLLRTRSVNPAFLEVTFDEPREVLSAQAFFPGGAPHEWALLAGDDQDHMRVLFEGKRNAADAPGAAVPLSPPVTARIFRVVAKRLAGDDHVHFGEISLVARQHPVSLRVQAPSSVVCPSGDLPVGVRVDYDGGYRSWPVQGLGYQYPADAPFRLEGLSPNGLGAKIARYEGPKGADGPTRAPVRARIKGRGFWLVSEPFEIEARAEGLPDWSVGWIERLPRIPFDGPGGGLPARGDGVVYKAHVKNYGTCDAPRVRCAWQVDGMTVNAPFLEGIPRFLQGTSTLRLDEDGRRHDVRFVVDPEGAFPEASEANNEVTIQSDALRVGFWVERPLLDHFHRVQASFKDGANGWEDWAQRQVRRWNRLLAEAKGPLAPGGVADRVALDLVVEADDGALPLAGGLPAADPDARDRTVDLQWGFPASLLDGDHYARTGERRDDNPLWLEGSLLRELGHARRLVDLFRLDVHVEDVDLRAPDGAALAGSVLLPVLSSGILHRTRSGAMMAGDYGGGFGPHEASALQRIAGQRARGGSRGAPPDLGEFLSDLPRTCGLRVLAADGKPLDGVRVRAWRRSTGPDGREAFRGEPVRTGETANEGTLDLSPDGADPFFEGRKAGNFDPGRGVLLLVVERDGKSCVRFVEVVPFNLAFWSGETSAHWEDVATDLPR